MEFSKEEVELIYSAAKDAYQKYYARSLATDTYGAMLREANKSRAEGYKKILEKINNQSET